MMMPLKNTRMKRHQIILLGLLIFGFSLNSFCQDELRFEVNKVQPFYSIPENKLVEVKTLTDLDKLYPLYWVKQYISVDVSAYNNGIRTTVPGVSQVLNQEQKDLLQVADRNREITVSVMYLPENSLVDNTVKEYDFKVSITPDQNAQCMEGTAKLLQYLKTNGIAKIESGSFEGYDLTAIRFTITDKGQVSDLQVVLPSKDPKIDKMMVKALSKMPAWQPAEFSNGTKVNQSFVLTIGNMNNCMVNLLNIKTVE
jgi:hypothetical protein